MNCSAPIGEMRQRGLQRIARLLAPDTPRLMLEHRDQAWYAWLQSEYGSKRTRPMSSPDPDGVIAARLVLRGLARAQARLLEDDRVNLEGLDDRNQPRESPLVEMVKDLGQVFDAVKVYQDGPQYVMGIDPAGAHPWTTILLASPGLRVAPQPQAETERPEGAKVCWLCEWSAVAHASACSCCEFDPEIPQGTLNALTRVNCFREPAVEEMVKRLLLRIAELAGEKPEPLEARIEQGTQGKYLHLVAGEFKLDWILVTSYNLIQAAIAFKLWWERQQGSCDRCTHAVPADTRLDPTYPCTTCSRGCAGNKGKRSNFEPLVDLNTEPAPAPEEDMGAGYRAPDLPEQPMPPGTNLYEPSFQPPTPATFFPQLVDVTTLDVDQCARLIEKISPDSRLSLQHEGGKTWGSWLRHRLVGNMIFPTLNQCHGCSAREAAQEVLREFARRAHALTDGNFLNLTQLQTPHEEAGPNA